MDAAFPNPLQMPRMEDIEPNYEANKISVVELAKRVAKKQSLLLVDVRSPVEVAAGRLQGMSAWVNIAPFSNEERESVGRTFKQAGRDKAVARGMGYTVPKIESGEFSEQLKDALRGLENPLVVIQCFRGGKRSQSMGLYFSKQCGVPCRILEGGYKRWKELVANLFALHMPSALMPSYVNLTKEFAIPKVCVVGGRSGVGKTWILEELRARGHHTIDLEGESNHKGSAFGNVPFEIRAKESYSQPNNSAYALKLGAQWLEISGKLSGNKSEWIFLEDEGPSCGNCLVPPTLYQCMLRECQIVCNIVVPHDIRLQVLCKDYAAEPLVADPNWKALMIASIESGVGKRLGAQRVALCKEAIEKNDFSKVADCLLTYYDRLYDKHLANAGGTGTGQGLRTAPIVTVEQASGEVDSLHVSELVDGILAKCQEFDEQN